MDNYNFWADLLLTFKSSPDWIKALWLLVPPAFLLALIAMAMRFGLAMRRPKPIEGKLVVPLWHRGGAVEVVDFAALPQEIGAMRGCCRPPSALSGISPTRGEIGWSEIAGLTRLEFSAASKVAWGSISPLWGRCHEVTEGVCQPHPRSHLH